MIILAAPVAGVARSRTYNNVGTPLSQEEIRSFDFRHGMKGRSRGYTVGAPSAKSVLSLAFNNRRDVIVVAGDEPVAQEQPQRQLVLRWAEAVLGLWSSPPPANDYGVGRRTQGSRAPYRPLVSRLECLLWTDCIAKLFSQPERATLIQDQVSPRSVDSIRWSSRFDYCQATAPRRILQHNWTRSRHAVLLRIDTRIVAPLRAQLRQCILVH